MNKNFNHVIILKVDTEDNKFIHLLITKDYDSDAKHVLWAIEQGHTSKSRLEFF